MCWQTVEQQFIPALAIASSVSVYFMKTLKLRTFKILSTGVDGGHYYISAEINHDGQTRKLIVLFKTKSDEKELIQKTEINVNSIPTGTYFIKLISKESIETGKFTKR